MKTYKAGFIGCGNMGGTLAMIAEKAIGGENIAVCDKDESKTKAFKDKYGADILDIEELSQKSEYIFLGVKPQGLFETLDSVKNILVERDDYILVSMVTGKEIEKISSFIGKDVKIIRIMPNIPCRVGEGMILCAYSESVEEAEKEEFRRILDGAGLFEDFPEKLIDAGSTVSGCGPAFVYMFIEALADAGVECGLPRDKAYLLACQTLKGSAESAMRNGNPGKLKDEVCSPGGTTIAGVHELESGRFRGTVMDAVTSAYKKTLSMKN